MERSTPFGQGIGAVDSVTMIESNYGTPGNLEVIARVGQDLVFFWRDSGPAFAWSAPVTIASGVATGAPSLIQSRFGGRGNFELVSPCTAGGFAHFWRNNNDPNMPWSAAIPFGPSDVGTDVSIVQSNYGNPATSR